MYTTNVTTNRSTYVFPQFEIPPHNNAENHPQEEKKHNLDKILKTALIKFSENKTLNRNEALKMYAYFNDEIENINCSELTYNDYLDLLSKNYISLKNVPVELITYEMCLCACKSEWGNFHYIPDSFINAEICHTICIQDPHALKVIPAKYITKQLINALPTLKFNSLDYIPDELKDYSVYHKACECTPYAIKYVPKNHTHYQKLLDLTTKIHGVHLQYFDEEKITPMLCQQACERDGGQLKHVPISLRNFQICKTAIKSSSFALNALPDSLSQEERKKLYELACSIRFSALRYMPEDAKTEELCLLAAKSGTINIDLLPENLSQATLKKILTLACQNNYQYVKNFPEQLITQELCNLNASNDGFIFEHIPEKFWNEEIWNKAKSNSHFVLYNLSYELFDKFKHLINFIPKKTQLNLLSSSSSVEQKLAIINFIDTQKYKTNPIINSNQLIEKTSPLSSVVNNPFIYFLIENAYSTTPLDLKLLNLGKSLQSYITCSPALSSNPSFDMQNLLMQHSYEMVGGRTLAFNISTDKHLYVKFKKTGEFINELQKEGAVYSFINNDTYLKNKLKSDLPHSIFLEKIPLTYELETQIKKSDDKIEIIVEGDNRYVTALTFQASLNYSRYAHLLDLNNQQGDYYHQPEKGILTACYDAGVLASMGMILPSLLPAFHDTSSKRRWIALHSTFKINGVNHPGTFGAWNTTASARPDLGYGGIRDLGDHEMFGEIKTYLQQQETQMANQSHPDEVLQRLGFCNAICETLLSALIIRSRLQQQNAVYHYTNKACLNDTQIFIENICNQFLSGFYGEASPSLLQELLQLDDTKYIKWLERSALETVYWTAAQAGIDKVIFEHSQDCYLKHVERDGIVSKTLYPDKNSAGRYNFFNVNEKLNLGANNATFPLITFMNGLTLLCVNLLAKK